MRDEDYSYLVKVLGEPTLQQPVLQTVMEKYSQIMPSNLIQVWQDEGFSQFRHGLYQIVNPDDWQPVVDMWIDGTAFEKLGKFYGFIRGAFGELILFNRLIGSSVSIQPLRGIIFCSSIEIRSTNKLTSDIAVFINPTVAKQTDLLDEKGKPLFERALKRLGPLGWNEMYAFEPALLLGGAPKLENLVKVNGIVHCTLLRQFIDKPQVPFTDIGAFLGVDTKALAQQAIDDYKQKNSS